MTRNIVLLGFFIVTVYARFSEDSEFCPNVVKMPLVKLWHHKEHYFGIMFKANWFQAFQFCRYHGLHLATILSEEENNSILRYINETGYYNRSFWLSGTDLQAEGKFVWMSTGAPVFYADWHKGNPDNAQHTDGQNEHCLHLWNFGSQLKWNDARCSDENFFICETQSP